ncbi:MAG: hypothetical protein KKA51_01885 [Nanoarchaeota archaeon]|nr:hypothetical protein [Nanoarchaeota archaeon]
MSLLIVKRIKEPKKNIFIVFGGKECEEEESEKFIMKTGFVDAIAAFIKFEKHATGSAYK